MTMNGERMQRVYPWLILIACCLIQGGAPGLITNTFGQFVTLISKDLSCSFGEVSTFRTICHLVSCALFPFAGKVLYRFGARLTLSVSGMLFALSVWGTAHVTSLKGLYFMAVLQGIGGIQLLMFCTPVILDNWFAEKKGFAFGVSSACAGIVGTIMNPIFSSLNAQFGWRTVMSSAAIVTCVMILPMTTFVIRLRPLDIQLKPYGKVGAIEEEVTKPRVKLTNRSQRLLVKTLIMVLAVILMIAQGFSAHVVNYVDSLGTVAALGAYASSMVYIGSTISKLTLGMINDKWNVKVAATFGIVLPIIGFLLYLFPKSLTVLVAGLLFGVIMGTSMTVIPLVVRCFFSGTEYSDYFSIVNMSSMLANAGSNWAFGKIYDMTGEYTIGLTIVLFLLVISQVGFTLFTYKRNI